jgi:hypothetical protein
MKKIYQNFDGLDISFRCALPAYLRKQLMEAKIEAQTNRREIIARIGPNQIRVAVAETGSRGGFAYRFSTGPDGATWFVMDSPKMDGWNIRVSCNSLMLALYGYTETKQRILKTLIEDLDAIDTPGEILIATPLERISRFDYCFDFISEDFEPNPKNFIIHSRATKAYLGNGIELPFSCVERSGRLETICIGKMPNRQVILYNKRKEILAHHKNYWWKIWKLEKQKFKGDIWRIEVRAGKKELNKWNLKRFRDFETKCGDVIIHALNNIKYVIPNENDKNRARWPLEGFWEICIKSTNEVLAEYICGADRKEVISDYIANIRERYKKYLAGVATSYTAVLGMDISEIPAVFDLIEADMVKDLRKNRKKVEIKFQKAKARFDFIDN